MDIKLSMCVEYNRGLVYIPLRSGLGRSGLSVSGVRREMRTDPSHKNIDGV